MNTTVVRRAASADAALLAELGARTFRDTFAAANRPEDLEAYLARAYGETQQRREIDDPNGVMLIGEIDDHAAGYAHLRRGETPACVTGARPVEIVRFYVDRAFHGRGIAQTLMDAARAAARDLGADVLWLGVWEHNPRAIAFYEKCGFRDVGSQPFLLGSDLQTDRVMIAGV